VGGPEQTAFSSAYYREFYGDLRGRVGDRKTVDLLGEFVCSYLKYLDQPVRRVLDIGCGLGFWQQVIARHYPTASYTGVEYSEYLCTRLGWQNGSAVDFYSAIPFDLVICDDVLQYLSNADATAAIDNLATLSRGALYINALTTEDWEKNCDRKRTDGDVFLRNANWYRRRLRQAFTDVGGGVLLSVDSPAIAWELGKVG